MAMPRPRSLTIEQHLDRVVDETSKAACYLVAASASRHVPRIHERWEEAPTQLAFAFLRQGVHMAFLSTLSAVVEETRDARIVNLPRLLSHLQEPAVHAAVAASRGLPSAGVRNRAQGLKWRFDTHVRPHIAAARNLRNNVVAHHGVQTEWPESTYRSLTRLMIRVVVMVDATSKLLTGVETNIRMNMTTVQWQATSLWSKGIDGDPDAAPGRPDDEDEWSGLPPTS